MSNTGRYVVFALDEQRYALHLASVERTVRAVEITPLPKAPDIVLGVINVRGLIIPVLNIRKRLGLPERGIDITDHIIIARASGRVIAFIADAATSVVELQEQDIISSEEVLPGLKYVRGVIKLKDGMVLVNDIDKFFSLEEEKALDKAMGGK